MVVHQVAESPEKDDEFDRLRRNRTFRGGGVEKWCAARLGFVGVGALGQRAAAEAVLTGAAVSLWDPDVGSFANAATQIAQIGRFKVDTVVERCESLRAGRAVGFPIDVRHAGIRSILDCDVLLDCTDDPMLAWPLTEISHGLGIPLLRLALDGSGQREFGRVLCSAGEPDRACQVCPMSLEDLTRRHARTPCPGAAPEQLPPTLAGVPMAMTISGLGLLQAQRLVTGNDLDRVLEREIWVDFDDFQIFSIQLARSPGCLSDHRRWSLAEFDANAADVTFGDLLGLAGRLAGTTDVTVTGYLHPINTLAICSCGAVQPAVGTDWAVPPDCPSCGARPRWFTQTQFGAIDAELATHLGILDRSLTSLGYPERGALLVIRDREKKRTLRALLS